MSPWSFDSDEPDLKKRVQKIINHYDDPDKDEVRIK